MKKRVLTQSQHRRKVRRQAIVFYLAVATIAGGVMAIILHHANTYGIPMFELF